jgi:hypothetical protein
MGRDILLASLPSGYEVNLGLPDLLAAGEQDFEISIVREPTTTAITD